MSAFLCVVAGATKKNGKPVYKRFEQFFDYKKNLAKIQERRENKFENLKAYLRNKEGNNGGIL